MNAHHVIIKKWLQSKDDLDLTTREYQIIRETIKKIVVSDYLFRLNNLELYVDDIVSDIFFKLHNNRSKINFNGFFSYLQKTTRNYLIHLIKKDVLSTLVDDFDGKINKSSITHNIPDSTQESMHSNKKILIAYSKSIKNRVARWSRWINNKDEEVTFHIKTPHISNNLLVLEQFGHDFYNTYQKRITRYNLWQNGDLAKRECMKTAIREMKKSKSEDDVTRKKIDPLVGAILVDEKGFIIASSHRGKYEPKGHCEYNLFEHDVEDIHIEKRYTVPKGVPGEGVSVTKLNIKNSTLFVTLEPCSKRSKDKCSCADRIIYSGVKNVYIGLKDPDANINGAGIKKMIEAGIVIKSFPLDLIHEIITETSEDKTNTNLKFILSKNEFYLENQPEVFASHLSSLLTKSVEK